jgi:hypothetical protein
MPPLIYSKQDFVLMREPEEKPEVPINPNVLRAIDAIKKEGNRQYTYDLLELTRERIGPSYLSEYFSNKSAIHQSTLYKNFYKYYFPDKSEPYVGIIFQGEDANTNSMHLIFLRIITGCDAAHDFLDGDVFGKAYRKIKETKDDKDPRWFFWKHEWEHHKVDFVASFKEAIIDSILKSCILIKDQRDSKYENLVYALVVIDYISGNILPNFAREENETVEQSCYWCLTEFIKSDDVSKKIVKTITEALGVISTPLSSITGKDLTSMKDTLRIMGSSRLDDAVKITIDATSAAKNNLSLITGIIKGGEVQPYFFSSDPGAFVGYVEDTLVNQFDPAECGVVETIAKEVGSHVSFEKTINFDITFGLKGGPAHNMLTSSVYKNADGIACCRCDTFYGIQINREYKSGEVCKSKCAELIIEEYIRYGDWTKKKMYKNMFEISLGKQLGDLMISLKHIGDPGSKLAVSVDRIMAQFTSLASEYVIIDGGSTSALTTSVQIFEKIADNINRKKKRDANKRSWGEKFTTGIYGLLGYDKKSKPGPSSFGNVTKRIKKMSISELQNRLKSVGIKITKITRGKRKYLSRKELENKALLFNKLQNAAKRMKIKIMYKSKSRMYKYKTYKRLQKEINSKKMKNNKFKNNKFKNNVAKNFNFG